MPPKLNNLSSQEANKAIELLADAASRREAEFESFPDEPANPDEDCDSESPIFDSFYTSCGSDAIIHFTNYSPAEFHRFRNHLAEFVKTKYKFGRGRRSSCSPKDVLFVTLTTLKYGGNWDFMGRTFYVKDPTFERTVTNFVKLISDRIYETFVESMLLKHTMKETLEAKNSFQIFVFARYSTDVTFQQSNKPTGNFQESKKYFSAKHKRYAYKVEVSVLPIGMAVGCTDHHPGSISDLDMFYRNIAFQKWELALHQAGLLWRISSEYDVICGVY